MDKQVSRVPAKVASFISEDEREYLCIWDINEEEIDFITEEEFDLFMNYFNIGNTFIETEMRPVYSSSIGGMMTTLNTKAGKQYFISDKQADIYEDLTLITFFISEYVESKDILEFDSLYTILKALAEQIGIVKEHYDSKFEIAKSIYDKLYSDSYEKPIPLYPEDSTYGIVGNILNLANLGAIAPSQLNNTLTFDGAEFHFERTPEVGEYISGDLYVNRNKVGTYQGFTTENKISNWEEAALAIESQSFGNQALSIMKTSEKNWHLKANRPEQVSIRVYTILEDYVYRGQTWHECYNAEWGEYSDDEDTFQYIKNKFIPGYMFIPTESIIVVGNIIDVETHKFETFYLEPGQVYKVKEVQTVEFDDGSGTQYFISIEKI